MNPTLTSRETLVHSREASRADEVFGTHSLCADSEEKHEPASGVDTELVDSLKALDPERPIREADIGHMTSLAKSNSAGVPFDMTEASFSASGQSEAPTRPGFTPPSSML